MSGLSPTLPAVPESTTICPIEFWSEGDLIRGLFYAPQGGNSALPGIAMAHGYSAVKEQYLDRYARRFAEHGFGVLLFDHACFGDSDGQPRQQVDPERQRRGYRDALTWLKLQPGIEETRLGLWGSSYSGGHVLAVAAVDKRVKAVVAQVPTISGRRASERRRRTTQADDLARLMKLDRRRRVKGQPSAMVPVVSDEPDRICALPGAEAFAFFMSSAALAPSWRNEVTLRSIELGLDNEPGKMVGSISAATLMIVATNDTLTPEDLAEDAYAELACPKGLVKLKGGHFSPYVEDFDRSSDAALRWFMEHL